MSNGGATEKNVGWSFQPGSCAYVGKELVRKEMEIMPALTAHGLSPEKLS